MLPFIITNKTIIIYKNVHKLPFINHVDSFIDTFDHPYPMWAILLNKAYKVKWTFGKPRPSPLPWPHGFWLTSNTKLAEIMILLHLESAKVLGELYLRVRNRLSMSVVAHLVFVYQFQFLFLLQRCQSIEYIFLGTLL